MNKKYIITLIIISIITTITHFAISFYIVKNIDNIYLTRESTKYLDKNDSLLALLQNNQGYYSNYLEEIPKLLKYLLLKKEDKYFYYHFGLNPFSIFRNIYSKTRDINSASSTITLQLAKILLSHEKERTLINKAKEIYVALALETFKSKDDILLMYMNSVFLGNNIQGFQTASRLYFDESIEHLNKSEIISLLVTLNSPSTTNPFTAKNTKKSNLIYKYLNLDSLKFNEITKKEEQKLRNKFNKCKKSDAYFELSSLDIPNKTTKFTIDKNLTKKIRKLTYAKIQSLFEKNAFNASVIVIKFPENELISLIGSPNPEITDSEYKINMALRPRQIGSTVKPFIYTKGFEYGLRPYTLVNDREYKYNIASGQALYPKNYDYSYNGNVPLSYALANSLNVPTVQVLNFISTRKFSDFLLKDLEFTPYQDLDTYQLGIALGELDMTLLELSHFFTIFAQNGYLKPLTLIKNSAYNFSDLPKSLILDKKIFDKKFIDLTNSILSDRQKGIGQFQAKSYLNLPYDNYCVKTGTSDEFRDSLAIGYTKDYLVGVWVGNANFEKMDGVSGQSGAGKIWHDIMILLHNNSEYNKNTKFNLNNVTYFDYSGTNEPGLTDDNYKKIRNILKYDDLILSPHLNDVFLFEKNMSITLSASQPVTWNINDLIVNNKKNYNWKPTKSGKFQIIAKTKDGEEQSIIIQINDF